MTAERKIHAPPPPCLRPQDLANPALSIIDATGDRVATYSAATHTGAIFELGRSQWMLVGPLSLVDFVDALAEMQITFTDDAALTAWINAVAGPDHVAELLARH
jgi:hypothetical protein